MTRRSVLSLSIVTACMIATTVLMTSAPSESLAHCQIPCGIYDDAARVAQLREDATTIEKAIHNINELAGGHDGNAVNQAVRWVNAKEDHASHIIETVSTYFLTQRVKSVAPGADGYQNYLKKLADHHAVMVAAMKTKQAADSERVAKLRAAIDKLAVYYKN